MYSAVADTENANAPNPTVFKFQVEKLRFIAYLGFWGMCIFAIIVSTLTVAPNLGPCAAVEGGEETYGMHCSVLMDTFGFNNVSMLRGNLDRSLDLFFLIGLIPHNYLIIFLDLSLSSDCSDCVYLRILGLQPSS